MASHKTYISNLNQECFTPTSEQQITSSLVVSANAVGAKPRNGFTPTSEGQNVSELTFFPNAVGAKPAKHGFTLIEVMVVMGIITMIIGFTIAFDVGSLQRTAFLAESLNLATALQTARADALNNVNQKKHGVAIYPGTFEGFVIFEGDSFVSSEVSTRVEVPSSYSIERGVTTPSEVVFQQLSGDTSWNGIIELKDPNREVSSNIGINYEGRIDW